MDRGAKKRIVAMLLALVLMTSTLSVDVLEGAAAANLYRSSIDGVDKGSLNFETGTSDGSDINTTDGSDVSDNDQKPVQEEAFLVMDDLGETFGSYEDWDELLSDFAARGDSKAHYVISVNSKAVIGKTLPTKAESITLKAADKSGIIYGVSGTLNMTIPLVLDVKAFYLEESTQVININTKGKTLTLKDVSELGTVKGTSKGSLVINGNVRLKGNLQTFKEITVSGLLKVDGNVSSVTNLLLKEGSVHLTAGKKFTVTNVDATAGGSLGFPADGKMPTAKLNGTVKGVLSLKQFAEVDESYEEQEFAAGTKLLTAPKASSEQFALKGEKQVCYKKGSAVYVGAEVLELYKGEEHLGTYAQWSDLETKINSIKDKTAGYRVVLLDSYVVNGALSMPTKGRYAGLTFENGKGDSVYLEATGALTMTADMVLGDHVKLKVKQVSGATRNLALGEQSSVVTTGNLMLKNLVMEPQACVQTGGKLTVKGCLEASIGNELVLAHKKIFAIKDTIAEDRVVLKVMDKSGNPMTLTQNTTVAKVSGSSYATQYCLLDEKEQELPLYRKGNALKVQGTVVTPVSLYYESESGEISLGKYTSLADVRTEIGRRKDKQARYRVDIAEEIFLKGAIPLPKAGTYQAITFTGKPISTTGNLTLTGDTVFYNGIEKTKNDEQVPLTINLAKYTLKIPQSSPIQSLGNVSGVAGSCVQIDKGTEQIIDGNLKVDTLKISGILQVEGTISVTDVYPKEGNRLDYDLTKTVAIKGNVYGQSDKLLLNPLRNNQPATLTEGMKILGNAPKVVVTHLAMAQDTEWVLYRDGNAVRFGKPLLTVYENTLDYEAVWNGESVDKMRFARFNDAMAYINELDGTEFVVRLEENIPADGTLKTPASGKNVVVCGLDGQRKTLNMTGSILLNESSLHLRNIELNNKTASGPGITLKNGASLKLCDTNVNALSAPTGTLVTLERQVDIKGTVNGACDMKIAENAIVRAFGAITVNSLTLDSKDAGRAQLRLRVGKKFTIQQEVNTPKDGQFIINRVDSKDALAELGKGTVMVIAPYGQATQFKTQNIMPGTFMEWTLIKKGNEIQTSEATQGDGEWSGDFL